MPEPVHDDARCAASHREDGYAPPATERCISGTVYGSCGHEYCYGICEDHGQCICACHRTPTQPRAREPEPTPRPRLAAKAVLVDGPHAGLSITAADDTPVIVLTKPAPSSSFLLDPASMLPMERIYYRLSAVVFRSPLGDVTVRVGWSAGTDRVADEDLQEHVPIALFEQGAITWDEVRPTPLDRTCPIRSDMTGDPNRDCNIDTKDIRQPRLGLGIDVPLYLRCACGWLTEPVAMTRRSQLLRAGHRHIAEAGIRRATMDWPAGVYCVGFGLGQECYAAIRWVETTREIYGECRTCGWKTESVGAYRIRALREQCRTHIGSMGASKIRGALARLAGEPWEGRAVGQLRQSVTAARAPEPAECDSPESGTTCAHVCGPIPDHRCEARASTHLVFTNPAGGRTRLPLCGPCHRCETAATEETDATA